jgi:hypothetical protein
MPKGKRSLSRLPVDSFGKELKIRTELYRIKVEASADLAFGVPAF